MDSDAILHQQQDSTPPSTGPVINVDDEDEQAAFLNRCIEKETIDFEKSAQDKRNAAIDGKSFFPFLYKKFYLNLHYSR